MEERTNFGEVVPIHPSISIDKLKPSAETRRIIGELGLRYRPHGQTDLEAHAARLTILANDLADIPVHFLRQAADAWVRNSEFMPTAAELIRAARTFLPKPEVPVQDETSRKRSDLLRIETEARERFQTAKTPREVEAAQEWERSELRRAGLPYRERAAPLSRDELDNLPEDIVSMGLTGGFLAYEDGKLVERNPAAAA